MAQLPVGWSIGSQSTGAVCYWNDLTDEWQDYYPTETAAAQVKRKFRAIGASISRERAMRINVEKELKALQGTITELQATVQTLQNSVKQLQQPPSPPPASANPLPAPETSAPKEPRQPSSYKPPQPRTCQKCSKTFESGQVLFRHLPECQPFQCTKCNSTFPSNTLLHKHIKGCRRSKLKPPEDTTSASAGDTTSNAPSETSVGNNGASTAPPQV